MPKTDLLGFILPRNSYLYGFVKLKMQIFAVVLLTCCMKSSLAQTGTYPKILFSNRVQMAILDPNSDNFTLIANGISRAIAVDYHKTKDFVFWTDVVDHRIYRLQYPGTGSIETIISDPSHVQTPDGLAIDSENDHIYWTDTGIDKVLRANLDGTDVTVILDTDLEEPRAIVLDTTNRWMYLSDWGSYAKIEKCKFDGSSRQTLVDSGLLWPNGLALDMTQQKLYWADAGLDQIKSSNLDGTEVTMILANSTLLIHPFDIDIYGSHLYYADWYTGLMRVSRLPNSEPESLSNTLVSPMGLKVFNGVDVPSTVFNVTVVTSVEDGSQPIQIIGTNTINVEPVFKCNFDDAKDHNYLYDILWSINGDEVKVFRNVSFSEIDTTWLRPAHWVGTYHMNMYVRCSVIARFESGGNPSPQQYSPVFVAGIIPNGYVHEVAEGENITLEMKLSVPIGCFTPIFIKHCKETFKISYPKYTKTTDTCEEQIESGDLALERETCGLVFQAENWDERNDIIVHGYVDNLYNTQIVRTTNVHFIHQPSDKDPSGAWDFVEIPGIQIQIKDKDTNIELSKCESWSDPRYYTFDRTYFSKAISGEYVLYRHKRNRYWVHTLSTACWDGTCNVGIAIRSHNSLFVVRTSDIVSHNTVIEGRDHPYVNYRHCDDQNMVVRRQGNQYTIVFPSGTEIWFQIGKGIAGFDKYWIWHITVKPSTLDIEQTEGLCGYLSKDNNQNDDFKPRGSEQEVDLNSFITSWSIPENSEESLFTSNPIMLNEDYLQPFCICQSTVDYLNNNEDIGSGYNEVKCNLSQPLESCLNQETTLDTPFYTTCSSSRQKRETFTNDRGIQIVKRSSDDLDDIVEEPVLAYTNDFIANYFRSDPVWKNGWTEDEATEACRDEFNKNPQLSSCKEYASLQTEKYIISCVDDIKATGNTSLMFLTINKMLAVCVIEVSRNQTLINNTDDDSISEAKKIMQMLCPNNCSTQGHCLEGVCKCNNGFSGDDCSVVNEASVSGVSLPNGGRCGTRQRQCRKTNVYGDFSNKDIWYTRKHFEIQDFKEQLTGSSEVHLAEYRSPYMVTCELPSRRKRRDISPAIIAEGYYLSFSRDGVSFGEEVVVIIFDEECYSCNATTVTCFILETCSKINLTTSSSSPNHSNQSKEYIVVIVSVFCILLLIVLLVTLYLKCIKPSSMIGYGPNYQVDSFDNKEYSKCDSFQNVPPRKQLLSADKRIIRETTNASLFVVEFDQYINPVNTSDKLEHKH